MDKVNSGSLKYVNQVRSQMSQSNIMLCYRGEISQDIVIALLNLTEKKLDQANSGLSIRTRVFSVMVECLQNITQHSEKNEHTGSNIFMIGNTETSYIMYSGNVIKSNKVEELKSRIDRINTMSGDELKEFYKFLIKNESVSGEHGFGLGLIQIARKTGNPLESDFRKIDNDYYFFSIKTSVDH